MNTKTPESWQSDSNTRDVQIELSAERSLLLPFDHFLFAELTSDGKQQRLRLIFATHEVVVRGNALRRIAIAIQRRELSWLSKSPARKDIAEGSPIITEIMVKEIDSSLKSDANSGLAIRDPKPNWQ